jgi:hypothetical protein
VSKRYSIVYRSLHEVVRNPHSEWLHFYSAKSSRTLRAARKEYWRWVQTEWDYTNDLAMFGIWDNKYGKMVY